MSPKLSHLRVCISLPTPLALSIQPPAALTSSPVLLNSATYNPTSSPPSSNHTTSDNCIVASRLFVSLALLEIRFYLLTRLIALKKKRKRKLKQWALPQLQEFGDDSWILNNTIRNLGAMSSS